MQHIDKRISSGRVYIYVIVAWVVFVGMVMAFGVLNDFQKSRERFHEQSIAILENIHERLSINAVLLEGFTATISAADGRNRESIRKFARYMQKRYPHIFMFEIVDKVNRKNLSAFKKAYRNIYPEFKIKSFSYEGGRALQSAVEKDVYFPVVFMEPGLEESRKIPGQDPELNSIFRESFVAVLESDMPIASVPFRLAEGNRAYLLIRLVPDGISMVPDSVADASFAMLVVKAGSLMDKTGQQRSGFTTTLYHQDFARNDEKGHLFHYVGAKKSALEKFLFPLLVDKRLIDSGIEKFRLYRELQMGWADINGWLILMVFIIGLASFRVLMMYARQYHLDEMNKLETNDRLFYMANHDSLTGLANRNLMDDRLEHAIAQAKRKAGKLVVFFLDLNDFKIINDTHGHELGDKILKRVSERLRACLREEDTLARRSGDEFIILVSSLETKEGIQGIIEKIYDAFVQKFSIEGKEFNVGISIGTAVYPDQGITVDELMEVADISMYADKERIKSGK